MSGRSEALKEYYRLQTRWTYQSRNYILRSTGILRSKEPILEVGCGTGALLVELTRRSESFVVGVDRDQSVLKAAEEHLTPHLLCADAAHLPFEDGTFSAVVYHFTIMWMPDPEGALREARRVLQCGGFALALAEPDYGAALEFPDEFSLKEVVECAIIEAGGDPHTARKLPRWFLNAGFKVEKMGSVTQPLFGERLKENAEARRLFTETLGVDADILRRRIELEERSSDCFVYYPVFYLIARRAD